MYLQSPTKSLETTSSSVYPRIPFSSPSKAYVHIFSSKFIEMKQKDSTQ